MIKIQDLGNLKLKSSYNKSIQEGIKLLSIDYDDPRLFGSYSYKESLYPADIDLIDVKISNNFKDLDILLNIIMKSLQKTVSNLKNNEYLGDVKAGLDERYLIDLGVPSKNKLYNFNANKIKKELMNLYNKKLLDKTEYDKMIKLVKPKISHYDYEELYNLLRKHFLLRWTKDELLKGEKVLRGNKKIKLMDALRHQTKIKIDIWKNIYGRYIEITNFIVPFYKDNNGKLVCLFKGCDDIIGDLKKEIEKYDSKYYYKPFKMVKRMWALSRFQKDYKSLELLTPLIRSNYAILYQISSEMDTIKNMIQKLPTPPYKDIIKQMDDFKSRLAYINIPFEEDSIDSIIDDFTNNYKDIPREEQIEILDVIINFFSRIINENTIKYLKKIKYYPVPSFLLPA